jgi:hypothetical protein
MLTKGWDCQTVTHVVWLRPVQSKVLSEQVIGRGLRRASYDVGEDRKLAEEVATVFGVPFELVPLKAIKGKPPGPVKPRQPSGDPCEGQVRNPLSPRRGVHASGAQPRDGRLGRSPAERVGPDTEPRN